MKKSLSLLFAILLISCSDKKADKHTDLSTSHKTTVSQTDENWTDFDTKDSIPKRLNEALLNIKNGNFDLADPNERYNATDVIIDSLPRQKLSLLSRKGDNWRLTYIQGGFGKYYVYAQCKISNDSIYDLRMAESIFILENNDSIDKYILEKKLELKEANINMMQKSI